MRDGVFSKKFFYIRALFLLGFCCFCGLSVPDSYAADISYYYSFQYLAGHMQECTGGVIRIGATEDGVGDDFSVLKFEEDLVLTCDIRVVDKFDFNLSGHTISAIDGHKIITNQDIRFYGGNIDGVTIEANEGADLVLGSGHYTNLKTYAGARYDLTRQATDINDVYLQGGFYHNSTFFISQNASLDVDGASFTSDAGNSDAASIIMRLDDRIPSEINGDARLNIEAGFFSSTNLGCDKASIKLEAPDSNNNAAHIDATIEYARFEGQNAIIAQMGPNRTGDTIALLDGESELDGSYIIGYGSESDPNLAISNGEYMTKSSFYGDSSICEGASEYRASSIESGIFSNPGDMTANDGKTLLPLRDRDFDNDGKYDVAVVTGIDPVNENIELKINGEIELPLKNLDGQDVLAEDIEWLTNSEYVVTDGLKLTGKKAGSAELVMQYGTQRKVYIVNVIDADQDSGGDLDPGSDQQEDGSSNKEETGADVPLTVDNINNSFKLFVVAGLVAMLMVATIARLSSRRRIEK